MVVIALGFFIVTYSASNNKDKLCIYEIPNHINFGCPEGNGTREVHHFQPTIFEYENAISSGCTPLEELDDYGFRYEISSCDKSIPFAIR